MNILEALAYTWSSVDLTRLELGHIVISGAAVAVIVLLFYVIHCALVHSARMSGLKTGEYSGQKAWIGKPTHKVPDGVYLVCGHNSYALFIQHKVDGSAYLFQPTDGIPDDLCIKTETNIIVQNNKIRLFEDSGKQTNA